MTEGNKSQYAHCVKHCNISVLCMGKARAPRWLKPKARRCKKEPKSSEKPQRSLKVPVSKICKALETGKTVREVVVPNFCKTHKGNTSARKKWVSFMVNMTKDTLNGSSAVDETDIERQENAMMTLDLCENFVAAASLNESMPFDDQTSEFDFSMTRIFRKERLGLEFKGGDWIMISVDDTNETNAVDFRTPILCPNMDKNETEGNNPSSELVLFRDSPLPRPENGPGTEAGKERVLYTCRRMLGMSQSYCIRYHAGYYKSTTLSPLMIGGTVIDRVQSYKLLGLHISNDLTWNSHCETVYKKAVKRLYGLRVLKKAGMSTGDLVSVYCSIVRSTVEYIGYIKRLID
ncbi:uncharacterized protein [Montipora capricornis]|uniref:uncharacterized protein n=1 Tax=Montipora capricornis TaxID=246305 RepID=UPI0035F1E378